MITKTGKVWLGGAGGITRPLTISQYDTGWTFALSVYIGSALYDPEEAVAITLEGDKPDGTAFAIPGTFSAGVATFAIPADVSAVSGTVACELRVSMGDETVGTANFDIIVEAAPLAQHVTSEDNFAAMQALLDEVSQDAASAAQSAASAESAAGTAAQTVLDQTPAMVNTWLEDNIDPATGYALDRSLQVQNAAAPADLVGELKSALEITGGNEAVTLTSTWEIGVIYPTTGTDATNNTRIRCKPIYVPTGKITLTVDSGYQFYLYVYPNGVFDSTKNSGWKTGTFSADIPYGYIRVCVANTSGTEANVSYADHLSMQYKSNVALLADELNNMGFTYIPHGDSTFTIADMPPLSYSYVAATRFTDPPADDLASNDYCAIVSFPGSAVSGVPNDIHSILLYAKNEKRLFHGFKATSSSAVDWMELTTADALDNKGFTYIPYGDSTFTIADMPPLSYSYVAATRLTDPPADDLASGTYCAIVSFPGSAVSGVPNDIHSILLYSKKDKRIFHGWKAQSSDPVVWVELANSMLGGKVEEYSASNASNASLNILDRSYVSIPANSDLNGITYNRTGEGVYHLSGVVSTGNTQSFYNLITSSSTLVGTDFHPGDRVQVKISGNPNKVGLKVYLYPNTLPQREITYTKDGIFVIPDTCTGILVRLNVSGEGTDLSAGYDVKCGLYLCPTHDDVATHYKSTQEIKILVFGSSFSYSTLGYLPAMMNSIDPDVKITMGICYDSGQTVAGHISRFDNQTKYTTYSEYVPSSNVWSRWSSTYTPQNILSRHKWDYIVIQQACRSATEPISQVETFANKIQGYISYNTCFLFNMAQVLGANNTFPARYTQATGEGKSAAMYQEMTAYASALSSGYIVSDILPCGTAVQNARTSSLKTLGTTGEEYLCYDDKGHLCNGLPMMIGSITACYKLLSIVGRKPKIWGTTFVPTDAWKIQDNVPMVVTAYGGCIGTTPENILLAKKCALAAIKHPFEVTDFSSY